MKNRNFKKMSDCVCDVEMVDGYAYNKAIARVFHEWYIYLEMDRFVENFSSIYTPMDYVAFIFGWINIALFMVALCPQIVKNYKIKTVDALSTGLMIQW